MPGSTQATSEWVRNTLQAEFGQFSRHWRDHTSHPATQFLPLLINGAAAGHVHQAHGQAIAEAMASAFAAHGELRFFSGSHLELDLAADHNHDDAFSALAHNLAKQGLVKGWRDEWQWVGTAEQAQIARAERALFKTLGLQTQAIHVHVENVQGLVWAAVRAESKHENPGMLDNLAAGGVAGGESVQTTLWRELQEEAGLCEDDLDAPKALYTEDNALLVSRPLLHGGWHHEKIHLFKACLKPGKLPRNTDGEVQSFQLMNRQACIRSLNGWEFTPDAGLCTALALQYE